MTGYATVTDSMGGSLDPNQDISVAVACPVGTSVIGGGAQVTGSSNVVLYENTPQSDFSGWQASARNVDEDAFVPGVQLTVTAICAIID